MLDDLTVEQVKALLNFDGRRVTKKRKAKRFRCSCPFCEPAFKGKGKLNLHFDSGTYFCYRCGAKGELGKLLIDPTILITLSPNITNVESVEETIDLEDEQIIEIEKTFDRWKEYSDLLVKSNHPIISQIIWLLKNTRKNWTEEQIREMLLFPNVALSLVGENKSLPKELNNRLVFKTMYGIQGRSLNWAATSKRYYTWSVESPDYFVIDAEDSSDDSVEILCEGTFDALKLRLLGIKYTIIAVLGKEFFRYAIEKEKSYLIYPDFDWKKKDFVSIIRTASDRHVKNLSFFLIKSTENIKDPSEAISLSQFEEFKVISKYKLDVDEANRLGSRIIF